MTSRDFVYWLQGLFELSNPLTLNEEQTRLIRNHLSLVFEHEIDPSIDKGDPEVKAKLDAIHEGLENKADKNHSHPYQGPPVIRC